MSVPEHTSPQEDFVVVDRMSLILPIQSAFELIQVIVGQFAHDLT